MKRLLMLEPDKCASGDTTKGLIYEIIEDKWLVFDKSKFECDEYEFTKENILKYPNGRRYINFKDDSCKDSLDVEEDETRFIIFENDKDLAYELINRINGLDKAIVNMALAFIK